MLRIKKNTKKFIKKRKIGFVCIIMTFTSSLSILSYFNIDGGLLGTNLYKISNYLFQDGLIAPNIFCIIYASYLFFNLDKEIEFKPFSMLLLIFSYQGILEVSGLDCGIFGKLAQFISTKLFGNYVSLLFLSIMFLIFSAKIFDFTITDLKELILKNISPNHQIKDDDIKNVVGFTEFVEKESYNLPKLVKFNDITSTNEFLTKGKMTIPFGIDVDGNAIYQDIKKMPHMLVAGVTQSGKSVFINNIICSLLIKNSSDELKFVMIDLKLVELSIYKDIKHLMYPIITNEDDICPTLQNINEIMKQRLRLFSEHNCRDIEEYISKTSDNIYRILLIIDEFADMTDKSNYSKELIKANIGMINIFARKARAAGIHLIVAMQRPTIDIINGSIKTNIPTRVAFACTDTTASTVILDTLGAESISGPGEALYKTIEQRTPKRIKTPFIDANTVAGVVLKNQTTGYVVLEKDIKIDDISKPRLFKDELTENVVMQAISNKSISANWIRTNFGVGSDRGKRILNEILSFDGIVGEEDYPKGARQMLLKNIDEWEDFKRTI